MRSTRFRLPPPALGRRWLPWSDGSRGRLRERGRRRQRCRDRDDCGDRGAGMGRGIRFHGWSAPVDESQAKPGRGPCRGPDRIAGGPCPPFPASGSRITADAAVRKNYRRLKFVWPSRRLHFHIPVWNLCAKFLFIICMFVYKFDRARLLPRRRGSRCPRPPGCARRARFGAGLRAARNRFSAGPRRSLPLSRNRRIVLSRGPAPPLPQIS